MIVTEYIPPYLDNKPRQVHVDNIDEVYELDFVKDKIKPEYKLELKPNLTGQQILWGVFKQERKPIAFIEGNEYYTPHSIFWR